VTKHKRRLYSIIGRRHHPRQGIWLCSDGRVQVKFLIVNLSEQQA
jgi:hypothetical protein